MGYPPPVDLADPTMGLGARIKALRIRTGLKQEELAKAAGISVTSLAHYELGKIIDINPNTLQKIAKVLKIDPGELMPGSLIGQQQGFP